MSSIEPPSMLAARPCTRVDVQPAPSSMPCTPLATRAERALPGCLLVQVERLGSHSRAKATISSAVGVHGPSSVTCPAGKSSK